MKPCGAVRPALPLPLLLLAVALGGQVQAAIEVEVTPAWKGWTRPGAVTELDIRLRSDSTTRATLDLAAGRQGTRAEVELQPGRWLRLQIALPAAATVGVSVQAAAAPPLRREIALAQSESPLLGVGVGLNPSEGGPSAALPGFHTVALAADDLPRSAAAYSGIAALILDATVLAALDPRQLAALLEHATACGRIVLLNTEARVRRALEGAAGCAGQTVLSAATLAEAQGLLVGSLAGSLPAPISPAGVGALAPADHRVWNRVAVALAVYFAASVLALLFFSSLPLLLLAPALASAAVVLLLHTLQPASQLVVWSEGDAGAPLARYQAWQRFPGSVRQHARVAIPAQLGSAARACESSQALNLIYDAAAGRTAFAEFDSRLFRQVLLCYEGSFPMARDIAVQARADGAREVRNAGTRAWPPGALLADGLGHPLPALGPGASAPLGPPVAAAPPGAAQRTALARTPPKAIAALWQLDLAGVADAPVETQGWLLVALPAR